jgi:ABC-type branched-subunit amino acid transport system ATPase component
VRALRDVSFDLRAAEVHGLVGENGAGNPPSSASQPAPGSIQR